MPANIYINYIFYIYAAFANVANLFNLQLCLICSGLQGYAKKIQCRYRARLARKRMQAIKAEKLANQQKLAALKVQCAWRIFIARKRYRQKQDSKAVQEYNRQIHRFRGLIVAQSRLRGLLARQRINKLRIAYPSVMQVKIVSLDDQMSYSSSTSEPTALVSGMVLTMPADAPEILKASAEVSDEVLNTHGRLTSLYHCKPLSDAGAKTEVATATARNKLDYVVVTLVDTSSTAKGDLIGQVNFTIDSDAPPVCILHNYIVIQFYEIGLCDLFIFAPKCSLFCTNLSSP